MYFLLGTFDTGKHKSKPAFLAVHFSFGDVICTGRNTARQSGALHGSSDRAPNARDSNADQIDGCCPSVACRRLQHAAVTLSGACQPQTSFFSLPLTFGFHFGALCFHNAVRSSRPALATCALFSFSPRRREIAAGTIGWFPGVNEYEVESASAPSPWMEGSPGRSRSAHAQW